MAVSLSKMMELPGLRKWLAYAQPLIIAGVTFIVASRFASIGVDAHHDGIMFKSALDVAEGKILFRDTFTQYGALTTLLQALALKIFGHYLLVIRVQTAFFYALSIYFLWLIWKRFIPQWLATACGFIFVGMAPYYFNVTGWCFLPWSSVYSLFFLVLSLYFMVLFIEKHVWRYMLAAGISVALTLWCRQPVGVLLFFALLFFLVCWSLFGKLIRESLLQNSRKNGRDGALPSKRRGKRLVFDNRATTPVSSNGVLQNAWKEFYNRAALFLAGFFIVNVLFLAWLLFNHALKDMWLQSFVYGFMWAKQYSTASTFTALIAIFFPSCHAFSSYSTTSYVWATLPIICLILFFRTVVNCFWKKHFDEKQAIVFAAAIVCLSSWSQYYPMLCPRHVYWASAPMIGVFAYFVWNLFKNANAFFKVIVTLVIMGLLFQADITNRIRQGKIKLNNEYIALSYPKVLEGMRAPPKDVEFLQAIASDIDVYFRQHPAGGLINVSREALFSAFVSKLYNFHPLYVYWQNFEILYPNYLTKLWEYAANRRPIVISRHNPVICPGYTVKGLYFDYYIAVPTDTKSALCITAARLIAREKNTPTDLARDYGLDIQSAGATVATIRSIVAVDSDFNGTVMGAWYPLLQTSNSIIMSYEKMPTLGMPKPLKPEFSIPSSGKCQLILIGHDGTNYTKVAIAAIMNNNTSSRQTISILPPPVTKAD